MTASAQANILNENRSTPPELWSFLNAAILRRATVVALVLGSILMLSGQAEAIFGAEELRLLPLVVAFVTPFIVVTVSQLLGVQRAVSDVRRGARIAFAEEGILTTAFTHGIPSKAFRIGLLAGSVSTLIVVAASLVETGNLSAVSWALSGQAFVLPVFFGVLSQTIAYRGASRQEPAVGVST